ASGETESVPGVVVTHLQTFQAKIQCESRELLVQARTALYEALSKAADTLVVRGEMTYVAPFEATFDVHSTLTVIRALKADFQQVSFVIVGGEV
ncbi:hypothetical protein ABTA78_19420, partial [Acinetobacter baumannii]